MLENSDELSGGYMCRQAIKKAAAGVIPDCGFFVLIYEQLNL